MKRILLSLAGFMTMFTLMAAPVQAAVLVILKPQMQAQPVAETFMGTILKNGENFVLSDSATKTRYTLDDRRKARPFEGKTVKITGTLDMASNLIHVETIQDIV
jgi:phosphoglycerate dehydrogenase-like enzyme